VDVVTVQCPQHADPRQHRRAVALGDQDQSRASLLSDARAQPGSWQRQDVDASIA
jgi:hypothetical protein